MRLSSCLCLSAAFIAIAPVLAHAADYDPPIFVDQVYVPEHVPVEIGSGWYIRGDVGYNFDSNFQDYSGVVAGTPFSEDNTSLFGGAGFGYHFSDLLRTDTTINFIGRERARIGDASFETQLWTGMVNAYLDLGTVAGITPYVGAGAGVAHSRLRADAPGTSLSRNNYSFAYSLNAGVAYQMTDNLSLDVGYQYLSAPDAEYISLSDPDLFGEGMDLHQVKVGLRYDLW